MGGGRGGGGGERGGEGGKPRPKGNPRRGLKAKESSMASARAGGGGGGRLSPRPVGAFAWATYLPSIHTPCNLLGVRTCDCASLFLGQWPVPLAHAAFLGQDAFSRRMIFIQTAMRRWMLVNVSRHLLHHPRGCNWELLVLPFTLLELNLSWTAEGIVTFSLCVSAAFQAATRRLRCGRGEATGCPLPCAKVPGQKPKAA